MKHSYSFIKKYFAQIIILFLLVVIAILLIKINSIKASFKGSVTHEKGGSYVYTNPILDHELSQELSNTIVSSNAARNFVENLKEKKNIKHVSVYFRDLNNGPWIGVEEKEYFSPASMLKTPLLISLLKWSEKDQSVLFKEVIAEERFFDNNLAQHTNVNAIKKGESYTLIDVATKMIQQSDNVAAKILYEYIPVSFVDDTFTNIGVSFVSNGDDNLIRVKDIAAFYRILFNASYLNRDNSEKALSILSNTSYKDGLVAGVPKGITISHKFGERFASGVLLSSGLIPEGDVQIHDCGIVYVPGKPYILCVMTRGEDFKLQQQAISEISKFFYGQVTK